MIFTHHFPYECIFYNLFEHRNGKYEILTIVEFIIWIYDWIKQKLLFPTEKLAKKYFPDRMRMTEKAKETKPKKKKTVAFLNNYLE